MTWILVVLQVTSMYSGSVSYGWSPIGEFSSYESCRGASQQLVEANDPHHKGISKFVCIKK